MKPGGATKVAAIQVSVSEDKVRKTLHALQPAATDKENLVGAGRQIISTLPNKDIIKNEMSEKVKGDIKKNADKPIVVKSDAAKKVNAKSKTESEKNPPKKIQDKIKPESKKNGKNQKEDNKKGRIFKDVGIQTESKETTDCSVEDMTSKDGVSEKYWEVLAERRRVALQDALEENEILSEQVKVFKEMLDESRALVEVLQDMIGEDRNGIDNSLDDSRI